MLTKDKVINVLKKEQGFLKRNFGVKKIAIFGSFAKGTQRAGSDVDIFVEFDRPLGFGFFQLSDYLESKLGRKTDILTPGGIQGIRIKKIAQNIKRSLVYV